MKLYGLTGGIASGKSTVAGMLRGLGAHVIDADLLAREVVEPGMPALAEVARRWPACIRPDGRLDRAKLAGLIFHDPSQRRELETILHPAIQAEAGRRTLALAEAGQKLAFYEAALIFENGLDAGLDGVLLVACSPATQLARLRERDGLSEEDARRRVAAQLPLDEKRSRARWVIDTDRSLEDTRRQVEGIYRELEHGPAAPDGRA
ncbi:MAG TPA: dephospho-CoA kinase [Myxococcales bacterium]|nr:dephospho-CoA kinase [Myxococcales bacterium]